jgi:hypothetical protein
LMKKLTGWEPAITLQDGIQKTYNWIANQISLRSAKLAAETV